MVTKTNKPLISVIIPVYNAAHYLEEALLSAINQTWPNKEIILVDDGSTDKSLAIMKKYESDQVKVFSYATNKGQSYAINLGYKQSSGQLIKYLDADDLLNEGYLSFMMAGFKTENDLYFSQGVNFYGQLSDGRHSRYPYTGWKVMQPVDFLLDAASIMRQGGRWLIPRTLIEKAGEWDESLTLINDFEYFTRLSLASEHIYFVKDAELYYRQVAGGVASRKSLVAYTSGFNAILKAKDALLAVENSTRVRNYLADFLQTLYYSCYPRYSVLLKNVKLEVERLGGSKVPPPAGGVSLFLSRIFGWRFTFRLRHYFNNIRHPHK